MARNKEFKFGYTVASCYTKEAAPWGSSSTYFLMNNSFDMNEAKYGIENFGAVKFKDFLSSSDVSHYRGKLIEYTQMDDDDYLNVSTGEYLPAVGANTGGEPLANNSEFLSLITQSRVRDLLKGIYGPDKPFTELSNTLSVHYTARPQHRDLYPYPLDENSDYNLFTGTDHFTRIIFYLNYPGRASESLGVVPFSHRSDRYLNECKNNKVAPLNIFDLESLASDPKQGVPLSINRKDLEAQTMYLTFDPGDILAFDTRLFHCGNILSGPKYSIIATFAPEDAFSIKYLLKSINKNNSEKKLAYYKTLNQNNFASDTLIKIIEEHVDTL